ncbi:ABC transporter ATP-binding protein [Kibdelosporangium phytohabitans]|uniref:Multidrug ABC transporter ATP-binding protein n=1 Tax=Kibdelosporangium phytohabitans TaxID=860235 RepID=A0A0N9IH00_9PSEU|nr:ABC transporter ATP-binding protein [Kibdelosporangium phytohabitans]ALG14230.1 multidrug ABC transporter ATP-binding protein [Kibdelosporangium phytohabitans]MBE1466770.1 ATP-binding cassette subfamily C protein [Kibdelosporangium phytohabitans]
MRTTLPLADKRAVRTWIWSVASKNKRAFAGMMSLFGAATLVGLVGPQLLGDLVDSVSEGTTTAHIDVVALIFVGVLILHAVLRRQAQFRAAVFGERLLAEAREGMVEHVVKLPLSTVESAGTGDLLSRATSDVDKLDEGLRQAAPEITIATVTVALTAVAMFITSPVVALGMLVAVPVLVVATRWYRPRVLPKYEEALANWAELHSSTHETADGGRTVEALRLRDRRMAINDRNLDKAAGVEWYCSRLWAWFLGGLDVAFILPLTAILLVGGLAYAEGLAGIGAITAVVLYARAMVEPLNGALTWMDELQVGNAALRRILGVQEIKPDPGDESAKPDGTAIAVRGAKFAYSTGREVLHGIDLDIVEGERLVIVGPSGAGKSTLGRLLAGINAPGSGSVTIGGVEVTSLPLIKRRNEIVLVTQEQHVFAGTLRENLTLPRAASDDELWHALRTVDAAGWAKSLPDGLDTVVGSGGEAIAPAMVQQIALARLVVADPHTLVLDEATSLLDSSASGKLESSLNAVLSGRTVVAIAHRLSTARNADRIAVMDGGRIVELGSHDELMAAQGSYAALVGSISGEKRGAMR